MRPRPIKIPYIPLIINAYLYFNDSEHAREKIKEYNDIVSKYNSEIETYNFLVINEIFATAHNDKFNIAKQIEKVRVDIYNTHMSISDFEKKNNIKKFYL